MQLTGNTVLVTGGNSGIGRGMAEEFLRRGNRVIVTGRDEGKLRDVAAANPGLETAVLAIPDAGAGSSFGTEIVRRFPELDAVVHMAGIMQNERLDRTDALAVAEATVATNLLGPMRLNAALLPHLLARPHAAILTVTSGIAYAPLALTPSYAATKAGIHGWTEAMRYQLKDTTVQVIELIPPYVRTALMGERQASDPNAMPLEDYVAETFALLEAEPDAAEIVVERVKLQRFARERGDYPETFRALNERLMAARQAEWDALAPGR